MIDKQQLLESARNVARKINDFEDSLEQDDWKDDHRSIMSTTLRGWRSAALGLFDDLVNALGEELKTSTELEDLRMTVQTQATLIKQYKDKTADKKTLEEEVAKAKTQAANADSASRVLNKELKNERAYVKALRDQLADVSDEQTRTGVIVASLVDTIERLQTEAADARFNATSDEEE